MVPISMKKTGSITSTLRVTVERKSRILSKKQVKDEKKLRVVLVRKEQSPD